MVGRDSTALVELIKNAYDADATRVVVHGEQLGQHGLISIYDDGHGMTYRDFSEKFLRIAGRSKEVGLRRSPIHGRKFTGAKGIGRLSSHKLGSRLALESTPDLAVLGRTEADLGFRADIDWKRLEDSEASLDHADEILAQRILHGDLSEPTPGTLLTIRDLHSHWNTKQLNSFLSEVRSTRPDSVLFQPLRRGIFVEEPLIPNISIADSGENDPGFIVEMSGELEGSDAQWPTLLAHVNWIIEIDARDSQWVTYQVTPARRTLDNFPTARMQRFSWRRQHSGPRFASRIFVRSDGRQALPDMLARFASQASGVRLFFEGFRVLPYGAPRNDWLGLDRASSRREKLDYLDDVSDISDRSPNDERTYQLNNANYFGAVFLHDANSAGLQMVVNREGFLPGEDFDDLTEIVRRGINISVRLRAALGAEAKRISLQSESVRRRRELESHQGAGSVSGAVVSPSIEQTQTPRQRVNSWIEAGQEAASRLRVTTSGVDGSEEHKSAAIVSVALEEILAASREASEEQAQLRVLASLGTQLGAFVHEVNGVLGQARVIRDLLDELLESESLQRAQRSQVRSVRRAQAELIASLERQAVYLSDSLGAEARRRRARQSLRERWETASRLLGGAAQRRAVAIHNSIPDNLRTPPMFPAEMNVVFTNVLSNAIKAASGGLDESDRRELLGASVRASAEEVEGNLSIVVENTGVSVDLTDAERWFRPFETTTSNLDAVLGQGLGLGLPLTRRIVEEYGGTIAFVKPSPDMATALKIQLPTD